MAKAIRGKTAPAKKEIKTESKELVVPTESEVAIPIDPLYDLSPLERARQLPDIRKDMNSDKFNSQLIGMMNKTLPELNMLSRRTRNLSIQELMLIRFAHHALDKNNEDYLDRTNQLLDRAYGKSAQKIEHSGIIQSDSAQIMEAIGGIDDISIEEMEAIANLAKEKANATGSSN